MIVGIGLYYMDNSIHLYNEQSTKSQTELNKQNINGYKAQVASISSNLNLMVRVLSKEVLFSDLLDKLGSITPANVILTNLSIEQNQSAIDITAQSTDYNSATQLQINLADPNNKVFQKADIVSISCTNPKQAANSSYPCTVDIRALFAKNNPFLFINEGSKKGINK